MKSIRSKKLMASFLLVAIGIVSFQAQYDNHNRRGDTYRLLPPALGNVYAQESTIGDILDNEAGMAAYFQATNGIQLQSIKSVFRTIERETDEYIIGSVPVKDYSDTAEDVHVFVSSDGWIVVYYLASDPASKIVDVRAVSSSSTTIGSKFETVLQTIAAAAGVGYGQPSFYDFRYPEATHLMMVAGDNFTVELPSAFRYYERGASVVSGRSSCYVFIDNSGSPFTSETSSGRYSVIDASLMLPDTSHNLSSSCWFVLVLIYSEE